MNVAQSFLKSQSTYALRQAARQVAAEWKLARRHLSGMKKTPGFLSILPVKLNLGCGPNIKPGWINIDLFHESANLQLDLREPWPFPDGGVSHIYSEHVFEHFEFHSEVPHFLSESLRLLQPGGIFDVGVPDTEWPLRCYGDRGKDYWTFAYGGIHPKWCETQLDHINYHFRQGTEHKYAWDEETLARTLKKAGFASVARREFDSSLDTPSRKTGTLYMRAVKS